MPVSNGHRLKPSKLHSNSFPFFQGHPKIIPPLNYMENSTFSTAYFAVEVLAQARSQADRARHKAKKAFAALV
jgi:hypothetical protein